MKRLIPTMLLLCSVFLLGVAPTNQVPSSSDAYKLDHWMGKPAFDIRLGTKLRESHKVATGVWDFALVGGTAGATTLDVGIKLPDNAIIRNAVFETITSVTTGGTTEVCFQTGESACDLEPWTDSGSWSGYTQGTPDDDIANYVKLTAARDIKAAISGSNATAGKIRVYLDYILSE
jgi:hypothetical protein